MRRSTYLITVIVLLGLILSSTNIVLAGGRWPIEALSAPADFSASTAPVEPAGFGSLPAWSMSAKFESPVTDYSQYSTALAAGGYHTCALSDSGGVKCWGGNLATYGGQLGDGTFISRGVPGDVAGLTGGVTALAAGFDHTCVVMDSGRIKCWGYNLYGQLGDGTFVNRNTPVDMTVPITGVSALSLGYFHSCAVTGMGGVKCWGYNLSGQLGDGTTISRTSPVDVTGLSTGVTTIAAGGNHTCALTLIGGVQCWGANTYGQLGDGTTLARMTPVGVSGLITGVLALAAGYSHTCALMAYGGVRCWGYNLAGQLGNGTTLSSTLPIEVSDLSGVTAIVAGSNHTCAKLASGGLKCWGHNAYGQLGDGTTAQRLTPVDVNGLASGVGTFTAGGSHACAAVTGGQIKCWGRNSDGQLGDGASPVYLTPTAVYGLTSGVSHLATRLAHTCVVMIDGSTKCWGLNGNGQLGDETANNRGAPVTATVLPSGTLAVAPGWYHTCAVTAGGGAKCWGSNGSGQLGDGTTVNRSTPVTVTGLISGVTAIASGWNHACALIENGGVKCWGGNSFGQLGNGGTTQQLTPVEVISLTQAATAITAGYNHTCALTLNGGVKCWGDNRNGQLGDGSVTGRSAPVDVTGLISDIVAIEAGYDHTCALTAEGGLKCWGWNGFGQLGDGTTINQLTPAMVSGLASGVTAMAPGWSHTCAVMLGGGVKCWGKNEYGQLGDGTVAQHTLPADVTGLISGTTAIVAGHDHTCVITGNAGAKCWGGDFDGQTGANRLIGSAVPINVFNAGLDLGLTKWGPGSVMVGLPITYSLTAINQGTSTATGVIVTDTLPPNLTYVAAGPGCTYATGVVTCTLGTLSPYSGTATVSIVAITSATGIVTNTAQVSANETDVDPSDNFAVAVTTVGPYNPSVQFGASTYQVNEGAGTAVVAVNLSAPASVTTTVSYASLMTGTATTGVDYTSVSGSVGFAIGQTTATFAVPILEDALSEADETVLLMLSNPINTYLGSPATAVLTIVDNDGGGTPGVDVNLTKWAPSSVVPGSPISYSLTALNQGTIAATGVIVTDTLPPNVTFVAASGGCTHLTGIVTCNLGTLSPYSGTATASIVATPAGTGWITNTAQVSANETDVDPSDNFAAAVTSVTFPSPPVQFSASAYQVNEGAGAAIIDVALSAPAVMTTVVSYASLITGTATAGVDYTSVSGTLLFVKDQSVATFTVPILEDALGEPDETVLLVLSNPINTVLGSPATAVLTIADNDGGLDGVDLNLTKSAPGSVLVGSPISYSLSVLNQGNVTATGVVVTDTLPPNMTFVAASAGCAYAAGNVTCNLGTLFPYSGTAAASIVAIPSVVGAFINTAQVGANETDVDSGDNVASADTNVVSIMPSVQFEASNYQVNEGTGLAVVTMTLSAPAVTTMTMVNYASILSGTATAGVDYTPVSGTVWFGIGQSAAIFTVPILEDALSESDETVVLVLSNPVNVTLGFLTGAVLTIADNDGGGTPSVDLGLTKWGPSSVMVGSPISYSLTAINQGTITATGVIVTDTLPPNVIFVAASPQCVNNAGVVGCNLEMLPPYSGTATVSIVALASTQGMITNTAQVGANEVDFNLGNNIALANTEARLPTADLSVTKSLQGLPLPGEQVQYQIYYRNNGPLTAEDVIITDTLPDNVSYQAWYGYAYNPGYTNLTITPTLVNHQLVWSLGAVVPDGSGYLYPIVKITDTANLSETLTNVVRVSTRISDTNPSNDSYTHTVPLMPAIRDVYVAKSLNSAPGTAGSTIEYRIHVGNQGNAAAREIVITDTLPADVTYVSDHNWSGFTTVVTGTTVVWTRPTLEANSSADLYLQVRITDTASAGAVLTTVASIGTRDSDVSPANNVDIHITHVEPPSLDLAVAKSAFQDPRPSEEVEYVINYWNQGTTPASNVRLTDTLPAGTSYVWSNSVPTDINGNTVVWTIPVVPSYGSGYLSLRVRVTDTVAPGTSLINVAHISGDGLDVNPGNNSTAYSTTVRSLPGHITGIVTAPDGLTPLANINVQAYRDLGGWWSDAGGGQTDLAGNYDIGNLEPGVYRVRFYDWSLTYPGEYYADQPTLESATDISVTAGAITRYIDAALDEPAPPVAQATSTTGSVTTDPGTGEINIGMSRWNTGNITVTKEITCGGGVTPTSVTLVLSNATGSTTYPMVLAGPAGSTYQATLPADQVASGDLTTQFVCPGNPTATSPVGTITLYDPSGQITDAVTGDPVEGAQVGLFKVPGWQPKVSATDTTTNTCATNLTKGSAEWASLPPAPTELGLQADPQSGEIDPDRNPLFTNSQGRYGWNVAQGCWYIVVQKAGYEDRVSPLVGVPPEVTDLDLTLTPTPKIDQAIEFNLLPDRPFNAPAFSIAATASSGLPVTFTTSSLACTVEGTWVTLNGLGRCTITAHQSGDAIYHAALDVSRTFYVVKADQTITFNALADTVYGAPSITLTATATSGLTVTFSTNSLACAVTENLVTLNQSGVCTITAYQTGSDHYYAAPDVTQTFTIAKADTTTTLTSTSADSALGHPITLTAHVTSSAGSPTGVLTFTLDGGLLITRALNNGLATYTTTSLTAGAHFVAAMYGGDPQFGYSQSTELMVTVTAPIANLTAVSNSPTVLGHPTVLTATIGAGSNVSYTWNFGDGTIGTSALVSHHYTETGKYTAIVTAANSVSSLTRTVEVVIAHATASVVPTATTQAVFPPLPNAALPVTLTASIPNGAVASPANLVYTVLPTDTHPAPAKFNFAGANFSLEMYAGSVWQSDYQFNTPITLTLDYDPADLSLNENTLELRYWNGSAWVSDGLTLIQRDTVQHRLTITLAHLSEFALLGQAGYQVRLPLILR